jgi:DNA polymerase-3 subunit alpha
MDNIPSYIARKHGKEEPDYLHEMLEDILKETYGVIIYQEQVMQIAQVMGGYTLGGADLLRRAMGKKIIAEMDAQRKIFVEGAIKNNVDKSQASGIFDLVAKFAGYGFNKSHAAAYAMISYRTAYLRANYPVEFLAASLNLDIHDTDKINNFIQDAKRHDIPVLLPDINESAALFEPQHVDGVWSLRYALGALKNVGVAAMQDVRQERLDNGAYKDVFDFVSRVNPKSLNKRQLENLVRSGAFDLLLDNRRQLYESAELIVLFGAKASEELNSQQESFFDMMSGGEVVRPDLPPVEEWGDQARLQNEFEALGFYLASHPLDEYVDILSVLRAQTSQYVEQELPEGSAQVDMAGVVLSRRIRSSQRGRFASVLLSDATGLFEAFIYDEDLLSDVRDLLESGSMLWLSTTIRKDEGGVRIMIERAEELEAVLDRLAVSLKVSLSDVAALPALRALLGQRNEGRSRVFISVEAKGHRVKIELPGKYPVNLNAFKAMKSLNGIDKIEAFGSSSAM